MIGQKMHAWIERRLPDLTDAPVRLFKRRQEDAWTPATQECFPLSIKQREGAIMGRVTARSWRAEGRIYFEVRGPESPEANNDADGFVFCEAQYQVDKDQRRIEQFAVSRARRLWQVRGQIAAHSTVPQNRYRLEHEAGYLTLTFWAPEPERAESVTFRYQEDGQEAWISWRPHNWPVPSDRARRSLP